MTTNGRASSMAPGRQNMAYRTAIDCARILPRYTPSPDGESSSLACMDNDVLRRPSPLIDLSPSSENLLSEHAAGVLGVLGKCVPLAVTGLFRLSMALRPACAKPLAEKSTGLKPTDPISVLSGVRCEDKVFISSCAKRVYDGVNGDFRVARSEMSSDRARRFLDNVNAAIHRHPHAAKVTEFCVICSVQAVQRRSCCIQA